jgi:hypothetical protein
MVWPFGYGCLSCTAPFGLCSACIVVAAIRAAPYVIAGAKLAAEMLDPQMDLGTASVQDGKAPTRIAASKTRSYTVLGRSGNTYD